MGISFLERVYVKEFLYVMDNMGDPLKAPLLIGIGWVSELVTVLIMSYAKKVDKGYNPLTEHYMSLSDEEQTVFLREHKGYW